MSDSFIPGQKSSSAQLTNAFAAKLNAASGAATGNAAGVPTGTLVNRPVNPPNFTFYGATDVEQFQVYINGTWYVLAGNQNGVAPGPVVNLSGTASSPTSVTLTWSAPATGTAPFVYAVNYRITGTTAWTNATNTQSLSAVITGLQAATQYDFQVVTTGQASPPSTSATLNITTSYIAPIAPTGVTIGTPTSTTLPVSWTAPTTGTGPLSYIVKATASGHTTITSTPQSQTSYTLTGLDAGTTYAVTVTASNPGGSAISSSVNGTTSSGASTAPNAPTGLNATNILANGFTLNWTASTVGTTPISYQPEWAAVSGTTVSGIVREPYLQPASAQSVWNTPQGSGAQFSALTDADQIDLTSLACNINFGTPWGLGVWIGTSSDPLVSITSTGGAGTQRDPNLSASVHVPANATIDPTGDAGMILFDKTQPNKIWAGGPVTFNNGSNVTGGLTFGQLETDLTCGSMEDAVTGNYGYDAGIGLIRHQDLVQGKIQHALRWACDASLLIGQPPDWTTGIAWPQTHSDFNKPGYTGHIQPGSTIMIPASTNLDAVGLTTGGRMLADALQQFGALWRDVAAGGVVFYGERQDANSTLLQQMQSDAAKILPLLRILRNQGPNSVNGGGTPLYPAPPPLDASICTGSSGGGSGGAPSTFQPIGQPTTGTDIAITGLQPSSQYAFEVMATNSAGSATSAILYVTTAVSGSGGGGVVTPTTTWDSATAAGPITFSSDKLTAFSGGSTTPGGAPQGCRSTSSKSTGMFWFEIKAAAISQDYAIGLCNASFQLDQGGGLGADANGTGYYSVSPPQAVYFNGAMLFGGSAVDVNGATFTVVVDVDGQQYWVTSPAMRSAVGAKAWNGSINANPATKAGGASFAGMAGPIFICFNDLEGGASALLNTGASAPSITIPGSNIQPWDPGTTTGGGGGTGGSTGTPNMVGPSGETLASNSSVALSGISISDSAATGTCTFAAACSAGTLTATIGGQPVSGSGTSSLSYSNTFGNTQTVASTLTYTSSGAAGTDNVSVTFTDNLGQQAQIHIPITITASTNPQMLPAGPLSTLGAQIVDKNGNPVRICATGWNWYMGPNGIPAGLNNFSYKTMLSSLVNGGINCVRIGVAMCSVNRDDPFPASGTGTFYVANGKIIRPDGAVFTAAGLNVDTNASASQVVNLFPGINFIRFPCSGYPSPQSIASFVESYTSQNIVVEIENHPFPLINAPSGSALQQEANWYAQLANFFNGNPYVWFGSLNEPQGGNITAEQVAVYNAIRNAGNNTIIMLSCGVGSGNPGAVGTAVLDASQYSSMTNIVWDMHYYGWVSNFSTNLTTVENDYLGSVSSNSGLLAAQNINSANGVVPVLNGEFGPSTSGSSTDANATQVEQTVGSWAVTNGYSTGFAGWHWDADSFNAVQTNGNLTQWGKNLAGFIAAVPAPQPVPGGTGINYSLNPDLQGLNFNEALQAVINYGRQIGLRFIVDWHNQEGTNTVNSGERPPNGLWYDVGGASNGTDGGGNTGTISQQTYINLQTKLAGMFKGNDALIGIDLLNEPRFGSNPGSTWGGYTSANGATGTVGSNQDLRAAYQQAGNAALAANPDLLIICEGIQDFSGQGGSKYAPEGAVQAAQQWPVTLNVAKKLVYSGHIFPQEVQGATPDSGSSFIMRLNTEFAWLYSNNQGPPYWVGECGDNMRTTDGQNNVTALIAYLNGQDGGSGGPTFTAGQQGIGWDWWNLQVVQTNTTPGFGILSASAGGVDSVQQSYWKQMLYVPSQSTSGPPLIQAPLTGTVQTGTWQYGDFNFPGMTHGYMHYAYLLPHNYSTANSYPILVYEHENSEGDSWYENPTTDPTQNTIVGQDVIDGTFNTVAFRTAYPCIVIVPFCDQTSDPGGETSNFGGYNDGAGFTDPNERAVVAIVQSFWANFSCYQPKTYITGDSLGGIGSIAAILDCNRVNGPFGKVWTAALPYAGVIELRTPNPATDTATLNRMSTVPYLCLSGAGDQTSNVADYNQPVWQHYAGNTNYPAPPGGQAGSSLFRYAQDPTLDHNVWSGNAPGHNYRLLPDGKPFYDWLFSQEIA